MQTNELRAYRFPFDAAAYHAMKPRGHKCSPYDVKINDKNKNARHMAGRFSFHCAQRTIT